MTKKRVQEDIDAIGKALDWNSPGNPLPSMIQGVFDYYRRQVFYLDKEHISKTKKALKLGAIIEQVEKHLEVHTNDDNRQQIQKTIGEFEKECLHNLGLDHSLVEALKGPKPEPDPNPVTPPIAFSAKTPRFSLTVNGVGKEYTGLDGETYRPDFVLTTHFDGTPGEAASFLRRAVYVGTDIVTEIILHGLVYSTARLASAPGAQTSVWLVSIEGNILPTHLFHGGFDAIAAHLTALGHMANGLKHKGEQL